VSIYPSHPLPPPQTARFLPPSPGLLGLPLQHSCYSVWRGPMVYCRAVRYNNVQEETSITGETNGKLGQQQECPLCTVKRLTFASDLKISRFSRWIQNREILSSQAVKLPNRCPPIQSTVKSAVSNNPFVRLKTVVVERWSLTADHFV